MAFIDPDLEQVVPVRKDKYVERSKVLGKKEDAQEKQEREVRHITTDNLPQGLAKSTSNPPP